ncbi:MAG: Lrp/AsnC ligand binding domain-containing protein [Candidatus Methanofastidiosia archaeon]
MPLLAFVEIRADKIPPVKEKLMDMQYVLAIYEVLGEYNIASIVELENEDALFEFLTLKVRTIPGVEETKTHIIQDGIVI